jgi:hypothetical protein
MTSLSQLTLSTVSDERCNEFCLRNYKRARELFIRRNSQQAADRYAEWFPALFFWVRRRLEDYEKEGWHLMIQDEHLEMKESNVIENRLVILEVMHSDTKVRLHLIAPWGASSLFQRALEETKTLMYQVVALISEMRDETNNSQLNFYNHSDRCDWGWISLTSEMKSLVQLDSRNMKGILAVPRLWSYVNGYCCCNIGGIWYPIHLWVLSIDVQFITFRMVKHLDGNTLNNCFNNLKIRFPSLPVSRLRVSWERHKDGIRIQGTTNQFEDRILLSVSSGDKKERKTLYRHHTMIQQLATLSSLLRNLPSPLPVDLCHNIIAPSSTS